jgi:hypothetical protein
LEFFEYLVVVQVEHGEAFGIGQPFGDVLFRHGDMTFTSKSLGLLKPGIGIPGLGFVMMATPESSPFAGSNCLVSVTSVAHDIVVSQEEIELISLKLVLE